MQKNNVVTVDDHIVCPYQHTEEFTFFTCTRCKKFELTIGGKNPAPHCRVQKTRLHKSGFAAAAMLDRLGLPYRVVVDGPREPP